MEQILPSRLFPIKNYYDFYLDTLLNQYGGEIKFNSFNFQSSQLLNQNHQILSKLDWNDFQENLERQQKLNNYFNIDSNFLISYYENSNCQIMTLDNNPYHDRFKKVKSDFNLIAFCQIKDDTIENFSVSLIYDEHLTIYSPTFYFSNENKKCDCSGFRWKPEPEQILETLCQHYKTLI